MKRYNIFGLIHKGLRFMLYDTAAGLQRTDFNNKDQGDIILEQVLVIMDLFDNQTLLEDHFILPALGKLESSVTNLLEHEHIFVHMLSEKIRSLIQRVKHSYSDEQKIEAGELVAITFVEFMVFNLKHMAKEEDLLNKILWKYYSDDQIRGIAREMEAQISDDDMMQYHKWMIRAINNNDLTLLLNEVKNNSSAFAFEELMEIAGYELPVQRWNKVQESITEGALVL